MRTRLKTARTNRRRTQQEVADYLNIAKNYYQSIEAGTSDGSVKNWLKLFEFFDKAIPLDKLMENN